MRGVHSVNTVDRQAQGNLGGRNPGVGQTPMGDQDSTRGRRPGDDVTDPMTGRAPSQINHSHDKQEQ